MPVSEMELNEALSRAASLMTPEGQRRIEHAKQQNKGNYDQNGDYMQPSGAHNMRRTINENIGFNANASSSLPKAIRESILSNPINNDELSILDSINYQPAPRPQKQESYVNETYSAPQQYVPFTPPQPQYIPQPQLSIDYNYIRAIVNECVQANLKQIKEELLNESSLKAIRLGAENKIQLIDNKNNLYESKLEYKKNLTKK